MKHNLKTFPYAQTAGEMEAWIRKHERELRELLDASDKAMKAWRGVGKHRVDEELAMEWQGCIHTIKEILGE